MEMAPNPRPRAEAVKDFTEAAHTLATAVNHWANPSPAELAGAETMLVGMRRLIVELRGGLDHAAA